MKHHTPNKLNPDDILRKKESELRKLQQDKSLSLQDQERIRRSIHQRDRGDA